MSDHIKITKIFIRRRSEIASTFSTIKNHFFGNWSHADELCDSHPESVDALNSDFRMVNRMPAIAGIFDDINGENFFLFHNCKITFNCENG